MDVIDGKTPAEWVRALMEDEPERFKVGYTHENAVLAVRTMFELDDALTERLRNGTDPNVPCTVETWRGYPC